MSGPRAQDGVSLPSQPGSHSLTAPCLRASWLGWFTFPTTKITNSAFPLVLFLSGACWFVPAAWQVWKTNHSRWTQVLRAPGFPTRH